MDRNGEPQGYVLGQLLFASFIDDVNEEVFRVISKFADDTKIATRVNTLKDTRSMQRILDKLVASVNRWDMDFTVNKCGLMHIRKRNAEFQYQMNNGWVKSVDEENYVGVLMSKDLKFS